MIIDVQYLQCYLESVVVFDMGVDSDSTASSSSSPSSFLTDDFRFDLKNAPDGTPVPHSSAGELFDEGSGVDIMEKRGTVEPDGESLGASGLLQDKRRMDVFGSVSIPKFRSKKKKKSLLKLLPMLRLPRDFLFVPAADPAFDPTMVDGAGFESVSAVTFSVGLCSSLEDADCSSFLTTSSSIYQYLLVTVFDINTYQT